MKPNINSRDNARKEQTSFLPQNQRASSILRFVSLYQRNDLPYIQLINYSMLSTTRNLRKLSRFPTSIHIAATSPSYELHRVVTMDAKSVLLDIVSRTRVVCRSNCEGKFKMDATKKPLLIPPEFSNYAEKHGIFQIYEVRNHYCFTMVSRTTTFSDFYS